MLKELTFRKAIICVSSAQERLGGLMPPMGESSMCSWMTPTRRDSFQLVSTRMPLSNSSLQKLRKLYLSSREADARSSRRPCSGQKYLVGRYPTRTHL